MLLSVSTYTDKKAINWKWQVWKNRRNCGEPHWTIWEARWVHEIFCGTSKWGPNVYAKQGKHWGRVKCFVTTAERRHTDWEQPNQLRSMMVLRTSTKVPSTTVLRFVRYVANHSPLNVKSCHYGKLQLNTLSTLHRCTRFMLILRRDEIKTAK